MPNRSNSRAFIGPHSTERSRHAELLVLCARIGFDP